MPDLLDVTKNKILKHTLSSVPPLTIVDNNQKLEFAKNLFDELKKIPDITVGDKYSYLPYNSSQERVSIEIHIISPYKEIWDNRLDIDFSEKNQLCISARTRKDFFFRKVEDIIRLKDNFLKEYTLAHDREKLKAENEIKRGKIKGLKTKAILATIHEIAQEEGFEYMIETCSTKIKFDIRLSKNDYLEISIPFTSFQEVLQNAREAYHAIKQMKDNGVPIKIKYSIFTEDLDWKKLEKTNEG